jgi:uncharacterized protein YcfL
MKAKILTFVIILLLILIFASCSIQEGVKNDLGFMQNSKIVPNSKILITPFRVENKELQDLLTQDFLYYLIQRNKFQVSYSKSIPQDIKSLNKIYDFVIITKILRYDIKDFRPIFSIDMTVYNTFDGSIAWKVRYQFYWNDPKTEKFVSNSLGNDYDFNDFYNSKDSIKSFADLILKSISYTISKLR